jgi:hypothetical protein
MDAGWNLRVRTGCGAWMSTISSLSSLELHNCEDMMLCGQAASQMTTPWRCMHRNICTWMLCCLYGVSRRVPYMRHPRCCMTFRVCRIGARCGLDSAFLLPLSWKQAIRVARSGPVLCACQWFQFARWAWIESCTEHVILHVRFVGQCLLTQSILYAM